MAHGPWTCADRELPHRPGEENSRRVGGRPGVSGEPGQRALLGVPKTPPAPSALPSPVSHVLQTPCLSEVARVAVTCFNVNSHVLSVGATEAGIVSQTCHMIWHIKDIWKVFVE